MKLVLLVLLALASCDDECEQRGGHHPCRTEWLPMWDPNLEMIRLQPMLVCDRNVCLR